MFEIHPKKQEGKKAEEKDLMYDLEFFFFFSLLMNEFSVCIEPLTGNVVKYYFQV